jgi:acyl carrier protein
MTRDEIFIQVRDLLVRSFEIDPALIKPEALLFQELELDSIDAIDMVVQLQEWTGRYVPEESLRGIRTVDDVVTLVEAHLAQGEAGGAAPGQTGGGAGGAPPGPSGGSHSQAGGSGDGSG